MLNPDKLLLNAVEAGELIGISRSRVFRLIQSGELNSIKVGGLRRIPRSAVHEYVATKIAEARSEVA
jgi:excisionase family DNA binding protein